MCVLAGKSEVAFVILTHDTLKKQTACFGFEEIKLCSLYCLISA